MKEQVESTVDKAVTMQSTCKTEFLKGFHRSLLKDPRANSGKHVIRGLALENQMVDSRAVEQRAKDQPGGPRADDRNLNVDRRTHHAGGCVKRSEALRRALDAPALDIEKDCLIRTLQDYVEAVAWRMRKSSSRPTKVGGGLTIVHRRRRL